MMFESVALMGLLGAQVNKSMKIDEQATRKNAKAFTRTADAEYRLEQCQKNVYEKMEVNAKRKSAILTCHLKMFQVIYSDIRKIQFRRGRGIEELENIEEIQDKLSQGVNLPAVSSGRVMTDSQLLVSFALRGIGGLMIQESKMNLQVASRNLAKANAVSAQIDSVCIMLNGIAEHVEIVTGLLEKLGMLYIKSIKNVEKILNINGMEAERYSDADIEALNACLSLTKLVYRIINTPLVDENGVIEQESMKVINEGQNLLNKISKGE
ncbi:MAG: hypothetical protein IJW18_06555 [Lachnospiraceae bacterium]|nr:hypothetical protein [Lachnospiraceae bacterium]